MRKGVKFPTCWNRTSYPLITNPKYLSKPLQSNALPNELKSESAAKHKNSIMSFVILLWLSLQDIKDKCL